VLTIAIDGAGGVTGTGSDKCDSSCTIRGTARPGSAAGDIELGLIRTSMATGLWSLTWISYQSQIGLHNSRVKEAEN
jgi:hypothetical protein